MVDDILKEIMDDIQSMKPKQMKQYIYDHSKEQLSNKDVSEESQWINAKEKYGELEAIHVVSDLWGCSTHEVKRKIERWNNQWL